MIDDKAAQAYRAALLLLGYENLPLAPNFAGSHLEHVRFKCGHSTFSKPLVLLLHFAPPVVPPEADELLIGHDLAALE